MSDFECTPGLPSPSNLKLDAGRLSETNAEEPSQDDPTELAGGDYTLLERLDRRQNQVLHQLDELNRQIQALVLECQSERRDAPAQEAA